MKLTRHKKHPYLKRIRDFVYEVPLLLSLKQLLTNQIIVDEVRIRIC